MHWHSGQSVESAPFTAGSHALYVLSIMATSVGVDQTFAPHAHQSALGTHDNFITDMESMKSNRFPLE